jgi:hypothetical protein
MEMSGGGELALNFPSPSKNLALALDALPSSAADTRTSIRPFNNRIFA